MILKPGMTCSYRARYQQDALYDWIYHHPHLDEQEYFDHKAMNLGQIHAGEIVLFLEHARSEQGYLWSKVIYGEIIGWVDGYLIPVTMEENL